MRRLPRSFCRATGCSPGGPAGVASLVSGEIDLLVAGASSVVRGAIQGSDTVMIAGTKPQLVGAIMGRLYLYAHLSSDVDTTVSHFAGLKQRALKLDSQVDTLKLTRSKFEAGIATDLDVARQEAQVEATRSTVPNIQTLIQQSIHRLSVLLDQPPAALEEELASPGRLPAGPEIIPPGLPSELIRRRPDVRQAERQLAQATANIGVAVADLFPKFNLTGSLGLESLSLKNFASGNSVAWSFGPSVSWKIFSAGQVQANIHVQEARQQQALIQYRQSVLQAMSDVEDALVGYNQEQARRQSLRRAVDANRRATDLARQLNQAGVVDFLNVLQAQQSQFLSEDQLAQSDQNVATNLIALYKALGGGWEVTDPLVGEKGQQASSR